MINMTSLNSRFSEIKALLSSLSTYKSISFDEFYMSPQNFGGATRFIQLIAKYTIDIAVQIARAFQIKWQTYPKLFEGLNKTGILDEKVSDKLKDLSNFYLEKTLTNMKIRDVYEMLFQIDMIINNYSSQVNSSLKKHG